MRNWLITLVVALLAASSASAAILNVVDGQLLGASDVNVGGTLYDVEFLDGTCIELYSGCDNNFDFTFQTQEAASGAASALFGQVFVNGDSGDFGSVWWLTNGVEAGTNQGTVVIPFRAPPPGSAPESPFPPDDPICDVLPEECIPSGPNFLSMTASWNGPTPFFQGISGPGGFDVNENLSENPQFTFGVWAEAASVPEPSTALLLGFGLTGLSWARRGRGRS